MSEQAERIDDLLNFVRTLQQQQIGDHEKTLQLARFLNNPLNAPAKDHTDFQALLANFQWQNRAKSFKQAVQIDNFEKALLVIKEMLDDGNNQSPNKWCCSACTYANHPDFMLCEMCQTARVLEQNPEPVQLDAWQSSLTVGSRLDVLDCENEWVPAECVKETQKGLEKKIKVHYMEWDDNWDEWISLPSARISTFGSHKWKWRYPAGFHKSKKWEQSVYAHLSKPKKKKKHSQSASKNSGSKSNGQSSESKAVPRKTKHVPILSQSSDIFIDEGSPDVRKKPKKIQEKPVLKSEKPKNSPVIEERKNSGPEKHVEPGKLSSPKPKLNDETGSTKPQPQKPTQTTSQVPQKPKLPEPKKDDPKPKPKKQLKPNPLKSQKAKSKDKRPVKAKEQNPQGPVDEWDMCDEFGADMLQCTVCGDSFFDAGSHMMDFMCLKCHNKEIQEGYAIVVPE